MHAKNCLQYYWHALGNHGCRLYRRIGYFFFAGSTCSIYIAQFCREGCACRLLTFGGQTAACAPSDMQQLRGAKDVPHIREQAGNLVHKATVFSVGCHAAGVVEGMVGMNVGEERSITTEVGDTWWEPDALRGVEVRADIKLNELFEWDLPEVRTCLVSPGSWHAAGPDSRRHFRCRQVKFKAWQIKLYVQLSYQ